MATVKRQTWKTVLLVGLILLVLGLVMGGYIMWFVGVVLILLLAMGGGALLYRQLGPPDH
jgi:hypothetical protein